MFIVYYRNDDQAGKIIRPTPFVSISYSLDKNKNPLVGNNYVMGGRYNITLNGTLLVNGGSPENLSDPESILSIGPNYENNPNGNFTRTNKQIINFSDRAYSMFLKQQAIRALFAHNGQKMEILSIRNDEPVFVFYPEVESISFDEGTYTDLCRYTITLTAPVLFDKNNNILDAASKFYDGSEENKNYHVESYTDSWSLEPDDSLGITPNNIPPGVSIANIVPKIYRVTRNVSATGKTMYFPTNDNREEAWEQAKKFVKFNILKENIESPPTNQISYFPSYSDSVGSGLLNIPLPISSYNHLRSETINKTEGTYSLTDSWIIAPVGTNAVESYASSLSSDNSSPIVSISINGNIKGLSLNTADNFANNSKFVNALQKLRDISNNLSFDINSVVFKRARNLTPIVLNVVPNSLNITQNESTGEITYNVTYNNRPTNFIRNVINENIVITDTYPGDIYSIIPVINKNNGPILQYIGGRTEYRRDLNIDLNVNRSNIGYYKMEKKGSYIYKKPSIDPIISQDLVAIINTCSPANEPTIRKYFLSPPSESWDPKTGKYSIQISWTYELNT